MNKISLSRMQIHLIRIPKKFKAFTILELMVGLAMTSILLLMGFYAFQLVEKQFRLYVKSSDAITVYQNFQFRLSQQMEQAEVLKVIENELTFEFSEYKVSYQFLEEKVLVVDTRDISVADTLDVRAEIEEVFFRDNPVDIGLVDELHLTLFAFGDKTDYFLKKEYGAVRMMEQ